MSTKKHSVIACYIIKQKTNMLKTTMSTDEYFADFCSAKEIHVNDALSCNFLYDKLPSLVVYEVENLCSNHLTQWFTNYSLSHLIAPERTIATLVFCHLFNLPIKKSTVTVDFSKIEMCLLSLHSFLFQNADIATLKESVTFNQFNIGILAISQGTCLFGAPSSNDIASLSLHVKKCILPISLNTQHV